MLVVVGPLWVIGEGERGGGDGGSHAMVTEALDGMSMVTDEEAMR